MRNRYFGQRTVNSPQSSRASTAKVSLWEWEEWKCNDMRYLTCSKHLKVNIHRRLQYFMLSAACRHDHQNACYWYLPPYKWCCFLCASSLHTPFPSFKLHCQTSSARLFAPGFANFSFSAMFCHLNFCQMLLPQFSPLQSLPYFNFIHIFCHLIFFLHILLLSGFAERKIWCSLCPQWLLASK